MNAVEELFARAAKESPSDTAVKNGGKTLVLRDQYGTEVTYDKNTLKIVFGDAEDDVALLAEGISEKAPIRLKMDDDDLVITVENVSPEEAIKVIDGTIIDL